MSMQSYVLFSVQISKSALLGFLKIFSYQPKYVIRLQAKYHIGK